MSLGYIFLGSADLPNLPARQFADLSIQDWDDLLSDWPKRLLDPDSSMLGSHNERDSAASSREELGFTCVELE